ncbi:TetR family transcriptional regulator [Vibrio sp. WXL210]|uniref:TetR family transcriptional regulator n=1 Tax=Vibrio sp. WXL210 TaxID=3450709 RepID=UPI003EC82FA8
MARKTKEEAERTRLAIMDSTLAVLTEEGLAKTTMSKVASHAGVTRGAIYWHFEDRDALLQAMFEQVFAPATSLFDSIETAQGQALRELLLKIAQYFVESVLHDKKVQQVIKVTMQWLSDQELLLKNRAQRCEENKKLDKVMTSLKQQGILNPGLTSSAACLVYNSFICGALEQWVTLPESLKQDDIPQLIQALDRALFVEAA